MRVEHEVADERIESLLTCAFEGGTGYWARIWKVEGPGSRQTGGYAIAPLRGGRTLVYEHHDHTVTDEDVRRDAGKLLALDAEAIKRGLALMPIKAPRSWGAFLAEDEDASVGDVFLQLCLLGEVRYA